MFFLYSSCYHFVNAHRYLSKSKMNQQNFLVTFIPKIKTIVKQTKRPRETTYALRGNDTLTMPNVNTTRFGMKSWRYQAPKLWNGLPDVLRASSDFKILRELLENESIL